MREDGPTSPWDEVVGPFTLAQGVQARCGLTPDAVEAMASQRRLLRVTTRDGLDLYPLWQFDGARLVRGLSDVLALVPETSVDGWTLAAWLRTPEPELGEAPLDALVRGHVHQVLAVARMAVRAMGG